MAKKWYVVHTYSGYENKVRDNLWTRVEALGLEDRISKIEIPSETVTEIKEGGKKSETERKVFPGYVLIKMEMDDYVRVAVRNTDGVTGFVGSQGAPEALTREEYNKIMKRTKKAKTQKRTSTNLEVGETVKVTTGPFADFEGEVAEVSPESGKVKVMVSIFGRETPVELSFDQIAKVS